MTVRRPWPASGSVLSSGWVVRTLAMQLLAMTAIHTIRPMASYRALELDASMAELGLVAASYAVLPFVLAVPVGRLVDRFGEPRFLTVGAGAVALAAAWLIAIDSLVALAASQALLGFGQLGLAVGAQTLLSNGGLAEGRDARIGALSVTVETGHMLGPGLGGALAAAAGSTLTWVWVASAAGATLATALAISVWLRPPEVSERSALSPATRTSTGRAVTTAMRIPGIPHAMLVSLAVLASMDILIAYLPAYGEARGIPAATVGLLLSLRAMAAIASRLVIPLLLRRLGRRRLLILALVGPSLAVCALPLTTSPIALAGLLVLAGFGIGLGSPLTVVWITNQVPVDLRGMALGLRITGNRGAQVAVPALVGAIAGAAGLWTVFVTVGALLAASAGAVLRSPLRE